MKKRQSIASIITIFAILFSNQANAQSVRKFGIGLNGGRATEKSSGLAFGIDLRYQFPINKDLALPLTIGYTSFGENALSYFPIKVGLKYSSSGTGIGIYGLAEIGVASSVETPIGLNSSFLYAPSIGYSMGNGLDLALKYEVVSSRDSYVGLRLGYNF